MPITTGPIVAARQAELDTRVRQHLATHPHAALSPHEISRALGRGANGKTGVVASLRRLEQAGHVVCVPSPNPNGTRPVNRWKASPPADGAP